MMAGILVKDGEGTNFPAHTIYAESGLVYEPFLAKDGRVGYRVIAPSERPDWETFIYFNPSTGEDDRNVFVYEGVDNDPACDGTLHYYEIEVPAP